MVTNTSDFIGDISTYYNEGLGPNIFDFYAEDISSRVVQNNPKSILELAAGTGIVTAKLQDNIATQVQITATDLNPAMMKIAEEKLGNVEGLHFQVTNAMELPFKDDFFDAILCQFGVMFFPEKGHSFTEARRVLKKGAHYTFNVWSF